MIIPAADLNDNKAMYNLMQIISCLARKFTISICLNYRISLSRTNYSRGCAKFFMEKSLLQER